jgi:hypothetical protein
MTRTMPAHAFRLPTTYAAHRDTPNARPAQYFDDRAVRFQHAYRDR